MSRNSTWFALVRGRERSSEQLDLFAVLENDGSGWPGLGPAEARSRVSPGWWPIVATLFQDAAGIVVDECREVNGELLLRVNPLRDPAQAPSVEVLAAHVREVCAHTCGCCGGPRTRTVLDRDRQCARVVCEVCHARLESGDSYATIADEYWRFDGARRTSPGAAASPLLLPQASGRPQATRECVQLSPDDLRQTIAEIRAAMASRIVGQEDAVARLALQAGLHVGGGLARGPRSLIAGPTGVGKTSLVYAMRDALQEAGWSLPFVIVDAIGLTSPGWSGAPSINDLIGDALGSIAPDSPAARHAIVVIDELAHALSEPDLHGNLRAKRTEVLASLLSLVGHGTLHVGDARHSWSSRQALVLGIGAFTGLLDWRHGAPTPADLAAVGMPIEFATRFEDILLLRPLGEHALRGLLQHWPALVSLVEVCERLGNQVQIHQETYAMAARAVIQGSDGSTARTAGGWLVTALRQALLAALTNDDVRELVVTPDSLAIARASRGRRPPDDPPDDERGWDATIILTPR